jgi:hypothetical protein
MLDQCPEEADRRLREAGCPGSRIEWNEKDVGHGGRWFPGNGKSELKNEVKLLKYTWENEKKQRNLKRNMEKNLYFREKKVDYG